MIRIDGSDLARAVQNAVEDVRSSVDEPTLRAVGFAGAAVFLEEAKRNAEAHVQTGLLYRSIIVKRIEEESDGGTRQVYLVTVRKGGRGREGAYYWSWVEHGHRFVPRNSRISETTGRKIGWKAHRSAAAIEYGTASAPAYPFMRPAYESHKGVAADAMTRTLADQMARNARR